MPETQDTEITDVLYRRYRSGNKEVLAIFLYTIYIDYKGLPATSCYQHVGQHGYGYHHIMIRQTVPANFADPDVQELHEELQNHYGYNLRVVQRVNAINLDKAHKQARDQHLADRRAAASA